MTQPDGTPPPPAEAPRVRHLDRDDDYTPEAIDRAQVDDTTRVPTTPSNDPPATDPHTPVPKAEPGPLTDVGPPHRTEPWSEHFAPVDVPRPGPVGPAATAPVDEADPEDGHPT